MDALAELIGSLPDGVVVTDPEAVEKYRHDWSRDVSAGTPLAVVRAEDAGQVQTAVRWAATHRVPVVPRGGGQRAVGWLERTGRRHRGLPRADAFDRDRRRLPGRCRRARRLQRRGQAGCCRARPVVPARPVVVRDLLDRRQHRDQRRWALLREVRRDHRLRARPRRGAGGRDPGHPRWQADQGRGRPEPAQAVRRQRGDAGHRHPGDPPPGPRPAPRSTLVASFPSVRRGGRGGRGDRADAAAVDDGADGPHLDQRGRGLQAHGARPDRRGCSSRSPMPRGRHGRRRSR